MTDERRHVSPSMRGEESRYILEEDGGRSVSLHKGKEGEGEAAALPGESGPLAGDAEVLAREAAGPESSGVPISGTACPVSTVGPGRFNSWMRCRCGSQRECDDVTEVRDARPSLGEDGAGVWVDLAEGDGAPSGTLKPKVKSSDPGEEGGVRELMHGPPAARESPP